MFPFIEATRRNHALEHATITLLLLEKGFKLRLAGRSTPRGFYVYGQVPTERLEAAAREALERLQAGESDLAVSPFCGTNLAVAGFLAAVSSALTMGRRFSFGRLPNAIFAATLAVIAAQPLGRIVQRRLTTSPALQGVRIARIQRLNDSPVTVHRVETVRD